MNFVITPYLQTPSADGVVVMWETDQPCQGELHVWEASCPRCGTVQYAPTGETAVFPGPSGVTHRIAAAGLKAATDYCYQAVSKQDNKAVSSDIHVFRTQPEEGSACSFAVTSETGGSQSALATMDALARSMAAERPDFLMFLGDMVEDGHRKRDWNEYLFLPFRALIANTPFYHCAGNHEDHSDLMKQYLATPEAGYYAFAYGCAECIVLDSTALAEHIPHGENDYRIELVETLTASNPQVAFLISRLQQSRATWKFVFLHYPPYFSGTWEADSLRPLCALFEAYGVDIVFTSHAIVYERSHPIANGRIDPERGVRYVVVGGAGATPQWFHHKKAWHTAKSRAVPHFVHISLTNESLELQAMDAQGALFDVLTLRPNARRAPVASVK
ncbi:MAG TPA: metallophosphoesterase [Clostridia bacterium]|nr:metallophosphoesterase [Clostridia bacterium]